MEELDRLFDGHGEDVSDIFAFVGDLERFAVEARAAADVTWHIDVGKELHFDAVLALSRTRFAAATFHVKAKTSGLVATPVSYTHLTLPTKRIV